MCSPSGDLHQNHAPAIGPAGPCDSRATPDELKAESSPTPWLALPAYVCAGGCKRACLDPAHLPAGCVCGRVGGGFRCLAAGSIGMKRAHGNRVRGGVSDRGVCVPTSAAEARSSRLGSHIVGTPLEFQRKAARDRRFSCGQLSEVGRLAKPISQRSCRHSGSKPGQ